MKATSVKQSDANSKTLPADLLSGEQIRRAVQEVLESTPFIDIHTHLFSPAFGKLGLWGIDELLTYHYLEAEFFRSSNTTPDQYWRLSKREQADAIWRVLFVENSPISEATRASSPSSMRLTCPQTLRPWKKHEFFSERYRSKSTFEESSKSRV